MPAGTMNAVAAGAGGDPPYGLYYDRREPSFYTGFAPRTISSETPPDAIR